MNASLIGDPDVFFETRRIRPRARARARARRLESARASPRLPQPSAWKSSTSCETRSVKHSAAVSGSQRRGTTDVDEEASFATSKPQSQERTFDVHGVLDSRCAFGARWAPGMSEVVE
jgi:hypothetical protein